MSASHEYVFDRRDLARTVGCPLAVVVAVALLLHAAGRTHLLPPPWPALDMDRTILVHQAAASRAAAPGARCLLVGDSSCLMSVAARELAAGLNCETLNLATLSYVDLPTHARLVRERMEARPGAIKAVVLLMHPESLRLAQPPSYYRRQIEDFLDGRDSQAETGWLGKLQHWLGQDILRGRVLSRLVPAPLPGVFGRRYGFTPDLDAALTRSGGSLVDPHVFRREEDQGNAEYRLARRIESESRIFRQAVPPGVPLVVGLTPVPQSHARSSPPEMRRRMLETWGQWLKADAVLSELPDTMPDEAFATVTHLSEDGARGFTERLAAALKPLLAAPEPH